MKRDAEKGSSGTVKMETRWKGPCDSRGRFGLLVWYVRGWFVEKARYKVVVVVVKCSRWLLGLVRCKTSQSDQLVLSALSVLDDQELGRDEAR